MQPDQRDASYLWDIVDAARTAIEATKGLEYGEYERNRVLHLAAERCIEIIGEAAKRVSDGFRAAHPEIPWQKLVSQRNVLAHEYRDIRHEKIWRVLTEHLPPLVGQLERLLPPPPAAG